jgi:hypothetical protein
MDVLDAEEPQRVDPEALRQLLAKYHRLDWLEDGWGRPFLISRSQDRLHAKYTIISLGRDGRRGACCQRLVCSWDDDAVLAGKDWLQVWYPYMR